VESVSPEKQDNYKVAEDLAWEGLSKRDPAEVARVTFSRLADTGKIELAFAGETYRIDVEKREVCAADNDEVPIVRRILTLHYLVTAKDVPLTGKKVGFAQIPGASTYLGPFKGRVLRPLVKSFGNDVNELVEVGRRVGAVKREFGDASITVNAFPKVPITYVLWRGDEEFPAEGQVMFDASIVSFLPLEDIVVVSSEIVYSLLKLRTVR
jgi:hypothetical protein